jgi:hypothetical protein
MHDSGSRVTNIMIPYVSEKNNNRSEGNTAESVRTNAQGLWT